ncbi:MAG: DegT/DnrJ/EryC1/StrS aminotransferase family protein, partial [Flavobacteriales bacterium]|nr:DegT/DnrJ/EryC1/StrS aminotransferase family protein [Flavobacteriales bacterium]
MMIPVFEPSIEESDIQAVVETLRRGEISGTFGESIPKFEEAFAHYSDCEYGVAVSSGSTALHMVITALAYEKDSEVLVSSNTNIASALAMHHNNLRTIPVDSEPDTWNMNLDLVEGLITPKTKAIMPVHIYGHPVQMEELKAIAQKYSLDIIEDCAEAHGATVNGKKVGSFGIGNCFSLYANKLITSGEGGIITTNDKSFYEELRLLRNLAFTKPRFYHEKAGFNF